MGFRDQKRALKARAEALERELEEVRRQRDELEEEVEEKEALEARVRELEKELGKLKPVEGSKSTGSGERSGGKRVAIAVTTACLALLFGVGTLVAGDCDCEGGGVSNVSDLPIDTDGAPTLGMVDLQQTLDPTPTRAIASGSIESSDIQSGCAGYVAEAPHLVIRTTAPMRVWVDATSNADLVMVVVTEDGEVHCDDDSGGDRNPRVNVLLRPGDHRVWVGPYEEGEEHPFSLELHAEPADAMPDETGLASRGDPALGTFSPHDDGDFASWPGSSRGMVDAETVDGECRGWLTVSPQLVLDLEEPALLRLHVTSNADAVLLLRLEDGTIRCNSDGRNPILVERLPAGEHRVWAGGLDDSPIEYALGVDARTTTVDLHPSGLAVAAPASLGVIDVPAGDFPGTARAFVPVAGTGPGCHGFAPLEPLFDMPLGEPRDVHLELTEGSGASILVAHPDGTLECDDTPGGVRGMWRAGLHKIWIAVPGFDQEAQFMLSVETSAPSIRPWSPNE